MIHGQIAILDQVSDLACTVSTLRSTTSLIAKMSHDDGRADCIADGQRYGVVGVSCCRGGKRYPRVVPPGVSARFLQILRLRAFAAIFQRLLGSLTMHRNNVLLVD